MTATLRRSGARRGGDDYQDIVALEALVDWLEHPDRYTGIAVEPDGAGFLDDVVCYHSDGSVTAQQVKFSVHPEDEGDSWDWPDLIQRRAGASGGKRELPSLWEKWARSWSTLRVGQSVVDAVVVSNRRAVGTLRASLGADGRIDLAQVDDPDVLSTLLEQAGEDAIGKGVIRAFRFELDRSSLDDLETEVRAKEGDLETAAEARSAAERGLRDVRAAERAASERRHALDLERQDLTGRIERIRERVEGEWGRTLERLAEEAELVEGDPDQLAAELRDLAAAIEALGPVNELAVDEHEEESKRLEFLTTQRDDLVTARNDLRSAIRDINRTATEIFAGTFERIRENFRDTFLRLFEDGHMDIRLADPDDPLECAIEIHASPRGKKTQRIELLSGGERAMVALALLFGIYLVKPSPFCVLDEVDSPLDEGNVGQFIKLIEDFKATTPWCSKTQPK